MMLNNDNKYPIDLAKEIGSHEITRIIEKSVVMTNCLCWYYYYCCCYCFSLDRESSGSLLEGIASPPYLAIMKEIDGDWIHRHHIKSISKINHTHCHTHLLIYIIRWPPSSQVYSIVPACFSST